MDTRCWGSRRSLRRMALTPEGEMPKGGRRRSPSGGVPRPSASSDRPASSAHARPSTAHTHVGPSACWPTAKCLPGGALQTWTSRKHWAQRPSAPIRDVSGVWLKHLSTGGLSATQSRHIPHSSSVSAYHTSPVLWGRLPYRMSSRLLPVS